MIAEIQNMSKSFTHLRTAKKPIGQATVLTVLMLLIPIFARIVVDVLTVQIVKDVLGIDVVEVKIVEIQNGDGNIGNLKQKTLKHGSVLTP